jgi:anti-sigma B factor antagonist
MLRFAQNGYLAAACGDERGGRVLSFRTEGRVLCVTGEVDAASSEDLRKHLGEMAGGGPFVLDMTEVDFIDSSGLRQLISAATKGTGGSTSIRIVPSPAVARLFRITGLDQRTEIQLEGRE